MTTNRPNGNGNLARLVVGSILALAQLLVGAVLLWFGSVTMETRESVIAMKVQIDMSIAQNAKDITALREGMDRTATALATVTQTTAAALATTTTATAAALAAANAANTALATQVQKSTSSTRKE